MIGECGSPAVFPHWRSFAHGSPWKTLPVCALPHRRGHLQPLRSGPPLLHPLMCRSGTTHRRPCRRLPLSGESARPSCPCRTPAPVSGQTEESDASGFPPLASSVPLQFEPTEPVIPAPWSCCRCHRPLPDRVRLDFLRYRIRRNRPHRSTHGPHPRN